jgi:excisionase family DNA binding protein
MTLDEVAEQLHLSRRTVERMVTANLLPAFRVSPRAVRVSPDELDAWLAGSAVGSSSADSAVGSSSVDAPAERDGTSGKSEAVEPAQLAGGEP